MMKKIISLLTVALMAVCFAGCTKDTATLRLECVYQPADRADSSSRRTANAP